jgi:curli biogenesis system outer membrane secretion channel CsgG
VRHQAGAFIREYAMQMKKVILGCSFLFLMAGCASEQEIRKDTSEMTDKLRTGPEAAPVRSVTNFTSALRCMDDKFLMYGIRDVVVITEDIADQTKKVSAGTKDMLITTVSEMTKRSRAIKLIAFGQDSANLITFMQQAEQKSMFQVLPQYGIRGSISQLDENIAKKTEGGGIAIEPFGGIGKAATAAATILGLDLTIMNTKDLTIIPGVMSNNSVTIMRSGSGLEGEAGYKKFGINYQMNMARSDGMAQALRNLVQLATVELFGKLTKTPYWSCLGGDINDETVATEISDWYQSLFAEPGEFVAYWQNQMRVRGLYAGEINGTPDDALKDAVMAYREAMGMEKSAKLDLAFFKAYLSANHYEIADKAQQILAGYQTPTAKAVTKANQDTSPISLALNSAKGSSNFKRGEEIFLNIRPSRDAFVYCFMQDENKAIMRFFPNRFARDPFITSKGIRLPKSNEFHINANSVGAREEIACFASNRDVFGDLSQKVGAGDFEPLAAKTLGEVEAEFQQAAGSSFGTGKLSVIVK